MVLAEKNKLLGRKRICGRTDQTRGWIKSILYISTRRQFYQTFGTDRPKAKGHIDQNGFIGEQIDWHPIRNEL